MVLGIVSADLAVHRSIRLESTRLSVTFSRFTAGDRDRLARLDREIVTSGLSVLGRSCAIRRRRDVDSMNIACTMAAVTGIAATDRAAGLHGSRNLGIMNGCRRIPVVTYLARTIGPISKYLLKTACPRAVVTLVAADLVAVPAVLDHWHAGVRRLEIPRVAIRTREKCLAPYGDPHFTVHHRTHGGVCGLAIVAIGERVCQADTVRRADHTAIVTRSAFVLLRPVARDTAHAGVLMTRAARRIGVIVMEVLI